MFATLIGPQDLNALLRDAQKSPPVILDVCCSFSDPDIGHRLYREGRIPGALFVDFVRLVAGAGSPSEGRRPLPEREAFRKTMESLGVRADRQIVVYDQGGLGFAARLWYQLRWLGLSNAALLNGGRSAWIKSGFPLSVDSPEPYWEGFIPALPALEEPVSMDTVQKNLHSGAYLVVDARPLLRFKGIGETVDRKAGHIPGSICRPGAENFKSDGTFKDAAELRREFLLLLEGRRPCEVVHSCSSGINAAINIFAMALAGLHGSRLYAGSWSQWIEDPSNPIACG